ncbi:solute carrier family 23 member 1-like [Babylonia areolata]|uniref:solute carrier family 23 member 1-like n=1 Tax=Babylonia areolata TaxID=304850 RepID=UPI003FD1FECE
MTTTMTTSAMTQNGSAEDDRNVNEKGEKKEEEEEEETVVVVEQVKEKRLYYRVSDTPPLRLVLLLGLQQGLLPMARSLSVSALVADVACGRDDGELRSQVLSATFLMVGLSTFTMSTFGVRLPIFQGPSAPYIIPLFSLMSMAEWKCPTQDELVAYYSNNSSTNISTAPEDVLAMPKDTIFFRMRQLSGSLMVAGGIHFLIGMTGLVGFLLRFIGPITIVPAITLVGLSIYKLVVRFCETDWTVAILVAASCIVLSMYLSKRSTPVPGWNRQRGLHVKWYPLHQVFAVLISIMFGWTVSAIFTHFDLLSKDRNSVQYYARTDTQLHIVHSTPWFSPPYPGQFGVPIFHPGVFLSFILATLFSVLDSIGDYNACARMCHVPLPPAWAVNRGIAVEGLMSFLAGAVGTGHATVSYGGNIGAIGLTKVASRRVFQVVGLMYVILAIFGKVGAVLATVPYSVLGGTQIITVGIFIGIVLSNLQQVDLRATRNVAIIGISLLMGLMLPHWVSRRPDAIQTGSEEADRIISSLLSNPAAIGGFLACFLDNTVPGTLKERGILLDEPKKQESSPPIYNDDNDDDDTVPATDDEAGNDDDDDDEEDEFEEGLEVYDFPWLPDCIQRSNLAKFVRIFPGKPDGKNRKSGYTSGMTM